MLKVTSTKYGETANFGCAAGSQLNPKCGKVARPLVDSTHGTGYGAETRRGIIIIKVLGNQLQSSLLNPNQLQAYNLQYTGLGQSMRCK